MEQERDQKHGVLEQRREKGQTISDWGLYEGQLSDQKCLAVCLRREMKRRNWKIADGARAAGVCPEFFYCVLSEKKKVGFEWIMRLVWSWDYFDLFDDLKKIFADQKAKYHKGHRCTYRTARQQKLRNIRKQPLWAKKKAEKRYVAPPTIWRRAAHSKEELTQLWLALCQLLDYCGGRRQLLIKLLPMSDQALYGWIKRGRISTFGAYMIGENDEIPMTKEECRPDLAPEAWEVFRKEKLPEMLRRQEALQLSRRTNPRVWEGAGRIAIGETTQKEKVLGL
jgi:hypothetical protein